VGKLQFIARCVRPGRIFISRLLHVLSTLKHQHYHFKITSEFRKDLAWWRQFLQSYNGISLIPDMQWQAPDSILSTDSCLTSCGGWCSKQYFSTVFPQPILSQNLCINSLELLTVMVSLRLWAKFLVNKRILIHCDNEASVCVLNSGRSKDKFMLQCLREIAFTAAKQNFQIKAIHVKGVDNRIADLLSRAPVSQKAASSLSSVLDDSWVQVTALDQYFYPVNDW
jgi:hypothetical protein